jgi:hypothetical protein
MWCARCQAEVAAETSAGNQRVLCASCGNDLTGSLPYPLPRPPEQPAAAKDPHELLARWAGNQVIDPFGPLFGLESTASRRAESPLAEEPYSNPPRVPAAKAKVKRRIDAAHPSESSSAAPSRAARVDASPRHPETSAAAGPALPLGYRAHPPHELQAPHFAARAAAPASSSGGWLAFAGQMVAYLGVGALTIGTALILVGYFGGPTTYAPTGWLITTVGQMFLFLGVVTLVSGGMEQTTNEVARRVDTLGEKIARLEHRALASFPRGPSFPVENAATDNRLHREQQLREQIALLQHELEQLR